MKKNRAFALENMQQSQLFGDDVELAARENFKAFGKAILETPYIWSSSKENISNMTHQVTGWDGLESAINAKKGVIILTLHMGCFEIVNLYFGARQPATVMYRPPRQKWLEPLIKSGRKVDNITLAEANASGVRKLMKTLKQGGTVGILPDQVPANGEGELANFFGKPAYTMTLASKLAAKTGAAVFISFGERLPKGKGYKIHFSPVESIDTPTLLNQAVETQIKACPSQYYWNYHRYKIRKKAKHA